MTIEFPGFQTLVPNEVYGKDTKVEYEDREYDFKNVFIPATYIQPSINQISENIFDSIEAVIDIDNIKNIGSRKISSLERKTLNIPHLVRIGLIENRNTFSNYLSKKFLEVNPHMIDTERFFSVKYGMIPAMYKELDEKKGIEIDMEWYENLLIQPNLLLLEWGRQWDMKVHEGFLPEKEKLYEAIDDSKKQSNLFRISGEYSISQVKEVVDALSFKLLKKDEITKLKDNTQWVLEAKTKFWIGYIQKILSFANVTNTFSSGSINTTTHNTTDTLSKEDLEKLHQLDSDKDTIH